jgi:spore germination protein GerM
MPTPSKKSLVHLYFIAKSNYFLMSERRAVIHPDGTVNFARAIIEALIKGPQEGLLRTIPSGTKLKAVFVTPDGVCYVDLSEEIRHNHPGGSNTELLTVYSIVNSLILNVPEIRRVKLLIDGSEVLTLAGHINLQFPVKANMLLIR